MTRVEEKRAIFHRYLQQSGVIEALSRALIRLYDEPIKPNDPVAFVRQHMNAEESSDPSEIVTQSANTITAGDEPKIPDQVQIEETTNLSADEKTGENEQTSEELIASDTSITIFEDLLTTGLSALECNQSSSSVLRQCIESVAQYRDVRCSSSGTTIYQCIRPGLQHPDHPIGMTAYDADCFDTFIELFAAAIKLHFNISTIPEQYPEPEWGNSGELTALRDGFIESITIRCRRNISGYSFVNGISNEAELMEISNKMRDFAVAHDGPFEFFDLAATSDGSYGFIADIKDPYLVDCCAATATEEWPTVGRAVLKKEDMFLVLVNNQDHIECSAKNSNGDLGELAQRLHELIDQISISVGGFIRHQQFGWLSHCPSQCGAGIDFTVNMKLGPLNGAADKEEFGHVLAKYDMNEANRSDEVIRLIGIVKFGETESNGLKRVYDCIGEIIEMVAAADDVSTDDAVDDVAAEGDN